MDNNNNGSKLWDRESIRLKGYDYSQPGACFVTICTHEMKKLYGRVVGGVIDLNSLGKICKREWFQTIVIRPYVKLHEDELIIMPDHIHGIIWITEVGATGSVARNTRSGLEPRSLGAIVGQYKSRTAKLINRNRNTPGKKVRQRNYYDRIIRNKKELQSIRRYIVNNPLQWEDDRGGSIHNFI